MLWIWKFDPFRPMDVTPPQGSDEPDVIGSSGGGNNDDNNTKKRRGSQKQQKKPPRQHLVLGHSIIQSKPQNRYLYIYIVSIFIFVFRVYLLRINILFRAIVRIKIICIQSNRQNNK